MTTPIELLNATQTNQDELLASPTDRQHPVAPPDPTEAPEPQPAASEAKSVRPDELIANLSVARQHQLLEAVKKVSYRVVSDRLAQPESEGGWGIRISPSSISRFVQKNGFLVLNKRFIQENDFAISQESFTELNQERMRKVAIYRLQEALCEPAFVGGMSPSSLKENLNLLLKLEAADLAKRRLELEERKVQVAEQKASASESNI